MSLEKQNQLCGISEIVDTPLGFYGSFAGSGTYQATIFWSADETRQHWIE